MKKRAWLLNLDAEHEVFRPGTYQGPFAALAGRPELRDKLGGLVPDGDVILAGEHTRAADLPSRAWCPTPRAIAALARAGARPPPSPPADAVRAALSRRTSVRAGLTLPGAFFTEDVESAAVHLRDAPPGRHWLLRRPWGFAGRGRLVVASGPPSEAALAFVTRAIADGGVLVEPFVERELDCALHGFLQPDGSLVAGEPCTATLNDGGVWLATHRAAPSDLSTAEREALVASLRLAASVLHQIGWFGPFGVDGFRYKQDGRAGFNPRCGINARYSMGWAVGMGSRRPDLD